MEIALTKEVIQKIANLARLKMNEAEVAEISAELSAILSHFKEIALVNTEGVVPLVTPSEIQNILREDSVEKSVSIEEMFANAPDKSGNLFKVPPVV